MNYKEFDGNFEGVKSLVEDVAKNDLGMEVTPDIVQYVIESEYGPTNGLIFSVMRMFGFNKEASRVLLNYQYGACSIA